MSVETAARPAIAPTRDRSQTHQDFAQKVAGTLAYADDWAMPGMLHGVIVRASSPCGRITQIDTSAGRAVEGVHAILTAEDVPHNVVSEEVSGLGIDAVVMPVLASDQVRYDGEPVALVAAETEWAAVKAAELVEVEIQREDGVYDPEDALKPDAPRVHPQGNVCVTWRMARGGVDEALARADVVVEGEYRTQRVDHAYLEPEAGVGWIDGDGVVTLRVSAQVIEHARQIAAILELPQSKVRVIAAYMGGGFGGKEDMTVEPHLALLVAKTRRAVRMVWTRQESLVARQKRHPFIMRYRTGAASDGRILAHDISIIANAGAYPLLSPRVLFAGAVTAQGPYRVENVRVESKAAFTHTVPTSAFRGFGAMQTVFGYEQQIDRVAGALGLDPAEVRRRNFVERGDRRVTGEELDTEVALEECLDEALKALGDPPDPRPGVRLGRGLACNMAPYGRAVYFADRASCWLGLEQDGTLVIRAGVTDLGGGQAASLVQIACEVLGATLDRTSVHIGDSALNPLVGGTFATRQLYMSGNATLKAARELREKLEPVAAGLLGVAADTLEWADNAVRPQGSSEGGVTLGELARAAEDEAILPYIHSTFDAEVGEFDPATGRGRSFPDYTYGAHVVDVAVDEETGEVQVLGYAACHDVGRAINPQRVEGQIQGAVAQGIGYALSEEVEVDEGVCTSGLFADYLIPTSLDLPDIVPVVLERHPGKGPLGARGIGEPPIGPVAPALAAALHDATGTWLTELPMTPERVLSALAGEAAASAREAA
jgi:xanthine dehydrogenase molybdenum-binding subunit